MLLTSPSVRSIQRVSGQTLLSLQSSRYSWGTSNRTSARPAASRSTLRRNYASTCTPWDWSSDPVAGGSDARPSNWPRSRLPDRPGKSSPDWPGEPSSDRSDEPPPNRLRKPPPSRGRPVNIHAQRPVGRRPCGWIAPGPSRKRQPRQSLAFRSAREGGGIWDSLDSARSGRRHRSRSRLMWAYSSGAFASA